MRWARLLLATALLGPGCTGGSVSDRRTRSRIRDLVGVEPPAAASDPRFQRLQFSSDLAMYDAYIRFDTSLDGYAEFMRRTGARPYAQTDPLLRARLSGEWKLAPGQRVDWWDCTTETPENAMAGPFGVEGFIVGKHEGGRAYVHVHDDGGTPGP